MSPDLLGEVLFTLRKPISWHLAREAVLLRAGHFPLRAIAAPDAELVWRLPYGVTVTCVDVSVSLDTVSSLTARTGPSLSLRVQPKARRLACGPQHLLTG